MNTELLTKEYQILEEVDSTNTALKNLASQQNLPEGFCLLTEYQRLGRGQYGKQWESHPGQNLLMSVYLQPDFLPASESYRLTMSVCLALKDLGEQLGLSTQVKWPNDWYFAKQKLAGVLAESSLRGSRMETCIVGIGINVKQKDFPYPNAASLNLALKKELEPMEVFERFRPLLFQRYLDLKKGSGNFQLKEFEAGLYGRDKYVPVLRNGIKGSLRCEQVAADGALKVRWESGELETIRHQEVQFLMSDAD